MLHHPIRMKVIVTALIVLLLTCVAFSANAVIYTYDKLYRLTSATYANGQKLTYTYDAGGNVLSEKLTSVSASVYYHVYGDVLMNDISKSGTTVGISGNNINYTVNYPSNTDTVYGKVYVGDSSSGSNRISYYFEVPGGTYTVTATNGSHSATATVTTNSTTTQNLGYGTYYMQGVGDIAFSNEPAPAGISLDSSAYSINVGITHSTVITATYSDGNKYDVTKYASYESSNPNVASVSAGGLVTGLSSGETVITVTYGGQQASANVTVVQTNTPPVVDAKGPYTGNEGSAITFSGSGTDADNDQLTYSWDFGDGIITPFSSSPTALHTYTDNGNFTATLTVKDSDGATGTASVAVTVNNVAPTVGVITAPLAPVQVNTAITASASFTDPGTLDTHTAVWNWDDGITSPGTVTETNGSGSVNGSHTYTSAGVYTVTLTVTDKDGGTGTSTCVYVIVYDPDGGFVTGGGWISSLAGAYAADPGITGTATLGFVSKYQKGASVPKGNTEFQFKAGNLKFHSTSYDWLVISGNKIQYKGSGTINGTGNYGFMLTAIDGRYNGGTTPDTFRIKITNKTDGSVVYDNQMNAADDADPTTVIGGGNIIIHN